MWVALRKIEARQRDRALNGEPAPDIARDVVAELAGEHRLDLLRLEAAHERVEEKDGPRPAEPCHRGIGDGAAPADWSAIHTPTAGTRARSASRRSRDWRSPSASGVSR